MSRTRVKICGVTRAEDAAAAAALGADAVGVVFAHSVRQLSAERARIVLAQLPAFVSRVGVFANQPLEVILEAIARCRLDAVQLSGGESVDLAARVASRVRVIRAVHVRAASDLTELAAYPADAFVLDAPPAGAQMGGTGRAFAWELLPGARLPWEHVIIAGGLTPKNVGPLLSLVRPYAVDVSSGVESAPGVKDPQRIGDFVSAVRTADAIYDREHENASGGTAQPGAGRADAVARG